MLLALALIAAVTATAPRPELIAPEPTTSSAKLLDAFQRAEDDFKSVQRELGLVGAAPLAGIQEEESIARRTVSRPVRPGVQKAALKRNR